MRALLTLAAVAAIAAAVALSAQPSTRPSPTRQPPRQPTARPAPARTPAPPRLERAAIDRQDRVRRADRVREARAYDSRPLLTRLPLTSAGVRIDIAGLAADDHATVLAIDPGRRSRAHARSVYRQVLRRHGDAGESYVLEWAR